MKKILIVGTNSNIGNKEIIDASRSIGVSTVFTDYYDPQDSPLKHYADEYWNVSTSDIDALEQKCRAEGITGVFGATADFAQGVALELSNRLGLPSYCDKASWHFSRNKVDFKAMCRKFGVPVAEDAVISGRDDAKSSPIGYPAVVKPSDRDGNRGVSYCYSDAEYAPAVEEALAESEGGQIIVERMLTGRQYNSHYVLKNGEARLLFLDSALSQPETPRNHYAVNSTVVEPNILSSFLKKINPRIEEMLSAMGCRDGYAFLQFLLNEQGDFCAIEMGHRLPGPMHWIAMRELAGFDAAKWMANYTAHGNNDNLAMPDAQSGPFEACGCGYILWTNKSGIVARVEGIDQIQDEFQAIVHVPIRKGTHVDAGRYGVIVVFTAADCDEMCQRIRFVNEHISMVNETGKDMLARFDDFETLHSMYSGR